MKLFSHKFVPFVQELYKQKLFFLYYISEKNDKFNNIEYKWNIK